MRLSSHIPTLSLPTPPTEDPALTGRRADYCDDYDEDCRRCPRLVRCDMEGADTPTDEDGR